MQTCDTDFLVGVERLQCLTHGGDARHVGTDGDSAVCEAFASLLGCNCCPKNDKKRNRISVDIGDEIVIDDRVFVLTEVSRMGLMGSVRATFMEVDE